ncbi:hypothetical protein [Bradyrhizobium sp. CSA112]|nr:hypothetical protein [Bradyrhizobium sp. CSA112]
MRIKLVSLAKAPPAINNVTLPAMVGAAWYMLGALLQKNRSDGAR